MNARRSRRHACAAFFVTCGVIAATGCGIRISLGELPTATDAEAGDDPDEGTNPSDAAADVEVDDAWFGAGDEGDASTPDPSDATVDAPRD